MEKEEYKIFLKIHDFECSPIDLTREIGLEATKSWQKGDPVPNSKIKRKQNTWQYGFETESISDLELKKKSLLEIILRHQDDLSPITRAYPSELSVVMYLYEIINPGIFFEKEYLSVLSSLEIGINIDIYFLGDQT